MSRRITRSLFFVGVLGLCLVAFQGIVLAGAKDPEYPTKPITFYLPAPAGGTTDAITRPLLDAVGKHLGQPCVVVNKPGGSYTLGAIPVMQGKPDGYTLGVYLGTNLYLVPHMEESPYKDISGFTVINNYAKFMYLASVRGDAPYKTWKELIEHERQKPKSVKVGLPGARSMGAQGIAMWEIEQKERINLSYVIFKGSNETLPALLGGHISLDVSDMGPARMQYIKDGKVRIVAFVGKEKAAGYEDIPSFYDLYGIDASSLIGIWGPRGIPNYILDKLEEAFEKGIKDPTFLSMMKQAYTPLVYMNRAQVNKEISTLIPKYSEIIKKLRIEEAKEKEKK
jgi:tripartite-type tricarboxylate transporter receptor subunit TctC